MLSGMAITAEAGAGDQDQVTHMTGTGDHHPDSGHMQMEAAAGSGQSGGMHGGMHGGVMKLALQKVHRIRSLFQVTGQIPVSGKTEHCRRTAPMSISRPV